MKILITGGAGFIGKWIVAKLAPSVEILIVDVLDPQVHRTRAFEPALRRRATCIQADVRDIEAYRKDAEGVDVIVHLAAQTGTGQSMYEISDYVQHNVDGTAKLLELISLLDRKPGRVVLASSRAIYGEGAFQINGQIYYAKGRRLEDMQNGIWEVCSKTGHPLQPLPMREEQTPNPISVYGLTKLWQEQLILNYCHTHHIDHAIFRIQNAYGPWQVLHNPYTGIIGIFTDAITRADTVELFEDGLMTRDFVYVEDVAKALAKGVMSTKPLAAVVNLGSGRPTTLRALVEVITKLCGTHLKVRCCGRFRAGDIRHAVADMSHYQSINGSWCPTPLEDGLRAYLRWYQTQVPGTAEPLQASLKEMEDRGLLLKSK